MARAIDPARAARSRGGIVAGRRGPFYAVRAGIILNLCSGNPRPPLRSRIERPYVIDEDGGRTIEVGSAEHPEPAGCVDPGSRAMPRRRIIGQRGDALGA